MLGDTTAYTEAAEALPSLSTGVLIGLDSEHKGAAVVQLSVGVLAVSGGGIVGCHLWSQKLGS